MTIRIRRLIFNLILLGCACNVCACGSKDAFVKSGYDSDSGYEASDEVLDEASDDILAEADKTVEQSDASVYEQAAAGYDSVNQIAVYVCGAVNEPGVYRFTASDIKEAAIDSAGGFADGAARYYVNLAEHMTDGEKLYVPYEDELTAVGSVDAIAYGSEAADSDASSHASVYDSDGRLNINAADKTELMTLPGIGESKADAIISYRDEHGGFKSLEEIMQINGIKEGVYNNIKDHITLD